MREAREARKFFFRSQRERREKREERKKREKREREKKTMQRIFFLIKIFVTLSPLRGVNFCINFRQFLFVSDKKQRKKKCKRRFESEKKDSTT